MLKFAFATHSLYYGNGICHDNCTRLASALEEDLNGDGKIGIIDLAAVGLHFRERC